MNKFVASISSFLVIAGLLAPAEGGPFVPPKVVTPRDLGIDSISVTLKPATVGGPGILASVDVVIKDWCKAPGTIVPYVQINLYASKGSKTLGMQGINVQMIDGAPVHATFNIASFNAPQTAYLRAEVNPSKTIPEVTTTNNYLAHNPGEQPFPPPASECKPLFQAQ